MAGFSLTSRGISEGRSFGRGVQGLLLPSGGDDTAAINAAITAGRRLGAGTFLFNGTIIGVPLGLGPALTVLKANAAGAQIQAGPALGGAPAQGNATAGNFLLDGNSTAGGSAPLLLVNVTGTTFLPVVVQNGLGDGVVVAGQNCVFVNLNTGGHAGCSLALDNGTGGNIFIKPELSYSSQYHVEFRQTVASPAGSYAAPENNYFYGGICEQPWNSANLGCVHHLAGQWNRFTDFNFFSGINGTHLVYIEKNTASGRGTDIGQRLYFRDCFFSGGGAVGNAIESSAAALNADIGVILQGDNVFSSFANAIYWPNTIPAKVEGENQLYTVTTEYNNGGAGVDLKRPVLAVSRRTLTDAATVNIDASTGNAFILFAGGSRTIAAPTNPRQGQEIQLAIWNNTAGAITTTWTATAGGFKMAAWTDAAAGKQRQIRFMYDGANWNEISRTSADY